MLRASVGVRPPKAVGDAYRGLDDLLRQPRKPMPSYLKMTRLAIQTPGKPKKAPVKKPKPKTEEMKITSNALGQFVRAYHQAKRSLRIFIEDRIEKFFGARKVARMNYAQRKNKREIERQALRAELGTLIRKHGVVLAPRPEDAMESVRIYRIELGPFKIFFAMFDTVTQTVFGFGKKLLLKKRGPMRYKGQKVRQTGTFLRPA